MKYFHVSLSLELQVNELINLFLGDDIQCYNVPTGIECIGKKTCVLTLLQSEN